MRSALCAAMPRTRSCVRSWRRMRCMGPCMGTRALVLALLGTQTALFPCRLWLMGGVTRSLWRVASGIVQSFWTNNPTSSMNRLKTRHRILSATMKRKWMNQWKKSKQEWPAKSNKTDLSEKGLSYLSNQYSRLNCNLQSIKFFSFNWVNFVLIKTGLTQVKMQSYYYCRKSRTIFGSFSQKWLLVARQFLRSPDR